MFYTIKVHFKNIKLKPEKPFSSNCNFVDSVCFGAPTRELFIDNQWFEVFFGGAPVMCDINGHRHTVKLEGPPPQIRPGAQRRDLVVGKVTLIIDAEIIFTVYLDAKPQK